MQNEEEELGKTSAPKEVKSEGIKEEVEICEICGKNPASKGIPQGDDTMLYICDNCYVERGIEGEEIEELDNAPTERIKLDDSGWIIEIKHDKFEKGCYGIEKIFAVFGHEVYFPIDTSEFSDEEWDMFHARLDGKVSD